MSGDRDLKQKLVDFSAVASVEVREVRRLINGNRADLSQLNTVEKSTVVHAINELLSRIGAIHDGEVSLEDIDVAVNDYFVLHPQSFIYEQTTPSSDFTIVHPLDHLPSVTLTDSAGTRWHAQITYPAPNKVRVQTNVPVTGKAVLT